MMEVFTMQKIVTILIIATIVAIVAVASRIFDFETIFNKIKKQDKNFVVQDNNGFCTVASTRYEVIVKNLNGREVTRKTFDQSGIQEGKEYFIGRLCGVEKYDSQLWLGIPVKGESALSRKHAILFCDNGRFGIDDNDSRNHMYRIEGGENVRVKQVAIKDSTEIKMGEFILKFREINICSSFNGEGDDSVKIYNPNSTITRRLRV